MPVAPSDILGLDKDWSLVFVTLIGFVVSGASFFLKGMSTYMNTKRNYNPNYRPSSKMITFIAIISAIAQNSTTALNIQNK